MSKKYCPDCGDVLLNPSRCDCGWKSESRSGVGGLPPWPQNCSVHLCDNDTFLAFLRVRDGEDRVRTGAASEFTDGKKLRAGFTFVQWITRCYGCYDRDLRGAGKQQLKVKDETKHPDMSDWTSEDKLAYLHGLIRKARFRRPPKPEPEDYLDEPYAQDGR